MTDRLYYNDPYLTQIDARVLESEIAGNRVAIVLDRSAFYPTGGGQPFDTGTLAGIPVLDVTEREEDGAVIHLLPDHARMLDGAVTGEIDWTRRFDHMQQHSGQHILSQAFAQLFDADTVGFHLSQDYSTIDLNRSTLTQEYIYRAEVLASRIVFENRPILSNFVAPAEAALLPLRKPPVEKDSIRIVQVEGFDWSACGGTHVSRTGAVGIIKVTHVEPRGSETRLTFLCGSRALVHYGQLNRMTNTMARNLTISVEDLPSTVERLQDEARVNYKENKRLRTALLEYETQALSADTHQLAGVSVLCRAFQDREPEELRQLAKQIVTQLGQVVLLGAKGKKAQLFFARSPELPYDMQPLLQEACRVIGGGGGGSPDMAQGGGSRPDKVDEALETAFSRLKAEIEDQAAGAGHD